MAGFDEVKAAVLGALDLRVARFERSITEALLEQRRITKKQTILVTLALGHLECDGVVFGFSTDQGSAWALATPAETKRWIDERRDPNAVQLGLFG
jgi:hypothetical protein